MRTHKINDFKLTFILTCVVSLSIFSTDIYLPAIPQIVKEYHATNSLGQLTLSSYTFGFAFSMLLAGPLSDKFGRKPILLLGLLIHLIATISCLFSTSMISLCLFRFFQALGGCSGTVLGRVIVKDIYGNTNSVKILSIIAMGMSLSPAIAPIIGGFLTEIFNWKSCFSFLAIFSFSLLYLTYKILPSATGQLDPHALNVNKLTSAYALALKNNDFIAYTAVIALSWCGYFSFISVSPFMFVSHFHWTSYQFGIVYSLIVISYIIGAAISRQLAIKLQSYQVVFISILTMLIASLLFFLTSLFFPDSKLVIIFFMPAFLMATGLVMANAQAGAIAPFSSNIGTIAGILYFAEFLLGSLAGAIMVYLYQNVIDSPALSLSIMLLVLSIMMVTTFYFFKIRSSTLSLSKKTNLIRL